MTESPLTPKENREKMAEIMFETLQIPDFYVGITAVCALYAFGKTTGIVLDSGHSVTHSVPIYEGFALPHAISKMDMGGNDLTLHLKDKIREAIPGIDETLLDNESITIRKEKDCYVASDFDAEVKEASDVANSETFVLPDKTGINLGKLRFMIPEVLFQPTLMGKQYTGIHERIY